MSGTEIINERIEALEIRLAYQDDTIEKLNAAVMAQWAQIEALQFGMLRARVGQKRPDGVIQTLGLPQHDVHQLRLIARELQLLTKDLHRP